MPKKNIRPLCGKPLIAYTIETALHCKALDRVVVSTDDPEIRAVALRYGAEAPFLRPGDLATDTASKWLVWRHLVTVLEKTEGYRCDILVDLDPTAPLRTVSDVESCLHVLVAEGADIVVSLCEAPKNPYFNLVEYHGDVLRLSKEPNRPIACRQDAPPVFALNASIYVMWRSFLMERDGLFSGRAKGFVMPPERSIDIDREIDFEFVEFLLRRGVHGVRGVNE